MRKRSEVAREKLRGQGSSELVAGPDTVLTVSYPEQVYTPVAYNSFRVGAVTLSVTVPEGEKVRPFFRALQVELEQIVDEQFERVAKEYAERIHKAAAVAKGMRR